MKKSDLIILLLVFAMLAGLALAGVGTVTLSSNTSGTRSINKHYTTTVFTTSTEIVPDQNLGNIRNWTIFVKNTGASQALNAMTLYVSPDGTSWTADVYGNSAIRNYNCTTSLAASTTCALQCNDCSFMHVKLAVAAASNATAEAWIQGYQ